MQQTVKGAWGRLRRRIRKKFARTHRLYQVGGMLYTLFQQVTVNRDGHLKKEHNYYITLSARGDGGKRLQMGSFYKMDTCYK